MPATTTSAADFARGDATGVLMPSHPDALRAAGCSFLTEAFRAFGSLGEDNAVARIVHCAAFPGGNSGLKLELTVEYERPDPSLDTELFAKFSRDLTDPFRDRRRAELEAEVRLARLSRHPDFPVDVARPWFADFDAGTGTGLLITTRIPFGSGRIEPMRLKCRDHELPERMDYYRATVAALARLAGAHHAGRLSPDLDTLFPFDRAAAEADLPMPFAIDQTADKAAAIVRMIEAAPQLFPAEVVDPDFLRRFGSEATAFRRHEDAVKRFLYADPAFVALCHWNSNIDNAWFWREPGGALRCGLLDWGMVRQMNVGISLWGGLSAASPDLWSGGGLDALLGLFAAEYHAQGGPDVDVAVLGLHFDLSVAMMGLALMMDAPELIASRLPNHARASDRLDPALREDQVGHGFLHVFTAFLELWASRDFGAALTRIIA